MLLPKSRHNPLPLIEEDYRLDDGISDAIRILAFDLHGPYNAFHVEGVLNKWDRPERIEIARIRVSPEPFEGIAPEASLIKTINWAAHVVFDDAKEVSHGINVVRAIQGAAFVRHGMILADRDGRPWLLERDPAALAFTGEERLHPLAADPSPIAKFLYGDEFSAGTPPVAGSFLISGNDALLRAAGIFGQTHFGAELEDRDALDAARFAYERIEAIHARRDRIAALVGPALTDEAMAPLFAKMNFSDTENLFPAHHQAERRAFDDALEAFSLGIMEPLRAGGLLSPCPNNEGRGVSCLSAWNAWVGGRLSGARQDGEDYGATMLRHRLQEAPAFKMIFSSLIDITRNTERALRRGAALTEVKKELAQAFRADVMNLMMDETSPFMISDLRGNICGNHYNLGPSVLAPILGKAAYSNGRSSFTPAEILETPGSLRHFEMDLPSGRLFMADWPRIKGFNDGLEALIGEDNHEINAAAGLDARQKDYLTKAGIAIIQVGNTSPYAYPDGEGVWRMGHFDEDAAPQDMKEPEPAWHTCTDLWANTFADVEVIADVLMASGQYSGRDEAIRAVEAYTEETWGATIIDLEPGALHVYGPTGYGVHRENFDEVFRSPALTAPIRDAYVLSRAELPLDCEVQHVSWRAPARETSPEPTF